MSNRSCRAVFAPALALAVVAGCGGPPPGATVASTASGAAANEAAASAGATDAERACLRDVAARTNNASVRVRSASATAGGTEVIVLVGPAGGLYPPAPWRCVARGDGSTEQIAFIGGA